MRVISGSAKGRRLKEPKGLDIRPTADQVKEAMFSIIQFEIQGARVLDMFAGTGQLGIEALSRGAKEAVFCDEGAMSQRLVAENLKTCGFEGKGRFYRGDSRKLLHGLGRFDVIILDPPYATGLYEECLEKIIEFDILNENGIIICEALKERQMPMLPAPYAMVKEYRYGKKKLTLYRRNGSEDTQ